MNAVVFPFESIGVLISFPIQSHGVIFSLIELFGGLFSFIQIPIVDSVQQSIKRNDISVQAFDVYKYSQLGFACVMLLTLPIMLSKNSRKIQKKITNDFSVLSFKRKQALVSKNRITVSFIEADRRRRSSVTEIPTILQHWLSL